MENVRALNQEEMCEITNALKNAAVNNRKKFKAFKGDAECAHHAEDRIDLNNTADRYDIWAKLDDSLCEAIIEGKLVMIE